MTCNVTQNKKKYLKMKENIFLLLRRIPRQKALFTDCIKKSVLALSLKQMKFNFCRKRNKKTFRFTGIAKLCRS